MSQLNKKNAYFMGQTMVSGKEIYFYRERKANSSGYSVGEEREEIPFLPPIFKKKHYTKHATQVKTGYWKDDICVFDLKNKQNTQEDYHSPDRIGNVTLLIKFKEGNIQTFQRAQYWEWIHQIIIKDQHYVWEKKNSHQLFIDQYFRNHTSVNPSESTLMIPLKFFFNWHNRLDQSISGESLSNNWELTVEVNSDCKNQISEMKLIMETYYLQGADRMISNLSLNKANVFQNAALYQVPSRGTEIYPYCINEAIYSFLGHRDYPIYVDIFGTTIRDAFIFCYLDGKYISLIKNINLLFSKTYYYHSPQVPIDYYQYFLPHKKFGKDKSGIYYLPFQYQDELLEVDNSPGRGWQIVITLDWDKYNLLSEGEKERLQIGIVVEESEIIRQQNGLIGKAFTGVNISFHTQKVEN